MPSCELPTAHLATCDGIHDLAGEVVGVSQAVGILEDSVAKVRKQRTAFNSMLDVVRDGQHQLQQVLDLRAQGQLPQAIETHYLLLACELKHAVLDCLHVAMRSTGSNARTSPLVGLMKKYKGGMKISQAAQAEELLEYLQLITGYIHKGPPSELLGEASSEAEPAPPPDSTASYRQDEELFLSQVAPVPPEYVSFSSSTAETSSLATLPSPPPSSDLSSAVAFTITSCSSRELPPAGRTSPFTAPPQAETFTRLAAAVEPSRPPTDASQVDFPGTTYPRQTQLSSPFTTPSGQSLAIPAVRPIPTQLSSPFTTPRGQSLATPTVRAVPTQLSSPFTNPNGQSLAIAAPGRPTPLAPPDTLPPLPPPPADSTITNAPSPATQPPQRTSPFLNQGGQMPNISAIPGRPPSTMIFNEPPNPTLPTASVTTKPSTQLSEDGATQQAAPPGRQSSQTPSIGAGSIKQQESTTKEDCQLIPYPTLSVQEDPATPGRTLPSQASRVSNHRCIEGRGGKLNAMILTLVPGQTADKEYMILAAVKKELSRHNVQTMIPLVQTVPSDILSLAQSDDGTTWLGLSNGGVLIENRGFKHTHRAFQGQGVSAIAVAHDGAAWVGGEYGDLKVLELDRGEGKVVEQTCEGGVDGSNVMLTSPPPPREYRCCGVHITVQPPAAPSGGKGAASKTITVICPVGRCVVVALGSGDNAQLHLWSNNGQKRVLQDVFVCGSYDTCTCITTIPWDPSKSNSKGSESGTGGERILTGHGKGAVLLWGDHAQGRLNPLIMIGKPASGGIRGLAACPSLGVLCVGLSKAFNVCQLPTPLDLENIHINSAASLDQTSIPYWSPVAAQVPAHRTGLRILTGAHAHVITGSMSGTVRIWPLHGILTVMIRVGMDQEVKTEVPDKLMKTLTNSQQVIKAAELHFMMQIGRGAYGEVYLALWKGIRVAVKKALSARSAVSQDWDSDDGRGDASNSNGNGDLNSNGEDKPQLSLANAGSSVKEQQRELLREVQSLASLAHDNVMRLLGVVLDERTGACAMIVTEYCPRGSVYDLIKKAAAGKVQLSWLRRLQILSNVAAGMLYLHTKEPHPVVHGDLRSPNLLIDRGNGVKIADFGSSRMLLEANGGVPISKACNPRWCPPEKLQTNKDSPAADVYSFAIIMWELLTYRLPFDHLINEFAVYNEVLQGGRPQLLDDSQGGPAVPQGYMELMAGCWAQDPQDRPQFVEVFERIQQMVKNEVTNFPKGA